MKHFLDFMADHVVADQVIRGMYGSHDTRMGCSMWCAAVSVAQAGGPMIDTFDHAALAAHLVVSEHWLRLIDALFESGNVYTGPEWQLDAWRALIAARDADRDLGLLFATWTRMVLDRLLVAGQDPDGIVGRVRQGIATQWLYDNPMNAEVQAISVSRRWPDGSLNGHAALAALSAVRATSGLASSAVSELAFEAAYTARYRFVLDTGSSAESGEYAPDAEYATQRADVLAVLQGGI